jgi:hypothetical protein
MNETFFSRFDFVQAVANCSENRKRVLQIPVFGSGPDRYMYGIEELDRYGRRHLSIAPFGLYASPRWEGDLEAGTLRGIVKRLTGLRTLSFNWTVRFDHGPLAHCLTLLGLPSQEFTTHILELDVGYEKVLAGFTSTIRNQIRRSKREGVSVVEVSDHASIQDYYAIYTVLAEKQMRKFIYPLALFYELAKLPNAVKFLMAVWQDKIIGGVIIIRDGCAERHWHSAADRRYAKLFPNDALTNYAIQKSCANGASFFSFGGSMGKASLEEYKSFWGARRANYWEFQWRNPFWVRASSLKHQVKRLIHIEQCETTT